MKKLNYIFFFICLNSYLSFSQTNDITPKYSNEFLAIGVSAQALGLSNAVVAGVDDVTSGYWNPAGLTNVTDFLIINALGSKFL
jgi:hypothetical protein